MDGAAYRFEQQLDMDSRDDYYADRFYDDDQYPEYIDPEDCTHGNVNFSGRTAECQDCESDGLVVVSVDFGETEVEDFILWNI